MRKLKRHRSRACWLPERGSVTRSTSPCLPILELNCRPTQCNAGRAVPAPPAQMRAERTMNHPFALAGGSPYEYA